jgi:hypothetical protein
MDDVKGQQTSRVLNSEAGAREARHIPAEQSDLNTPASPENATSTSSNLDQEKRSPTAPPPQSGHGALTKAELRRHDISRNIADCFLQNLASGKTDRASDEAGEIRGVWVASLERVGIRCLDSDSLVGALLSLSLECIT